MKLIIAVLSLLCIPGGILAATLDISWGPNAEDDLSGYKIYYGETTGSYGHVLNVGNVTSISIDGFLEGGTYYIAMTAYDSSGNESGFSDETVVAVPQAQQNSPVDAIIQWITTLFENLLGNGSQLSQYSIEDFSILINRDNIDSSLSAVQGESQVQEDSTGVLDPEWQPDYVMQDAITEVGELLDVAALYPEGDYLFLPLTEDTPMVDDGIFSTSTPGAYLYMVTDSFGELVNIFRVSVLVMIHAVGEFLSGSEMLLEDPDLGIVLALSAQALGEDIPIAIGIGPIDTAGTVTQVYEQETVMDFAIAPYGLPLLEPAVVSLPADGTAAAVEYYNEAEQQWEVLPDTTIRDGMIVFPVQILGWFRVHQEVAVPDSANQADASGSGEIDVPGSGQTSGSDISGMSFGAGSSGGGCFIATCSPQF